MPFTTLHVNHLGKIYGGKDVNSQASKSIQNDWHSVLIL